MKLNLNMFMVAAAALAVSAGAQAGISNVNTGNSSLLFVAHDATEQITLVVDLGLSMSDLLPGSALTTGSSPLTWNFGTDTASDASITGNEWSAAYNTFRSTQAGGDLTWGVIAGDSILGGAIAGRGMLATGNATATQMLAANSSTPTGTALGNALNFFSAANNLGTVATANNGAGTATSGTVFGAMGGTFGGGALTWNYLTANNVWSTFQYQQQTVANPVVFQIGNPTATDSLSSNPLKFRFDIATGELVMAVPEPSTYAMLIAGLLAVGFAARRRQA